MATHKRIVATLAVLGLALLPIGYSKAVLAQAVTQAYNSTTPLSPGIIVQLDDKNPSIVEPATAGNADNIHGVVVAANEAPVTLSNNNSTMQQVYVATSGEYQVLVSDQNGPIQTGDYISMSSISGVGMKSDNSQTIVIGRALSGFNGTSDTQGTTTLKEGNKNVTIHLGYVNVDFVLSHNPEYQPSKTIVVNNFLQKFGHTIANKNVSLVRVYISAAVLLVCAVIAGGLLYAGVRTSISALGRNPLAKRSILRSLVEVVFASLAVFIVGIVAV